uniref:Uncharacterized protein n=1 Tax=Aegilops tauschii subsp. strangulata TaxID=200361 RepID=A0A453DGK8_AEGTS
PVQPAALILPTVGGHGRQTPSRRVRRRLPPLPSPLAVLLTPPALGSRELASPPWRGHQARLPLPARQELAERYVGTPSSCTLLTNERINLVANLILLVYCAWPTNFLVPMMD